MKNYISFIKLVVIAFASIFIFISCKANLKKEKQNRIQELEVSLFQEKNGVIDKKEAANMIHAYIEFVDAFPNDTLSPQYLFKAADVSINTFHSTETIALFNRILKDYPDFQKAPQALFLKAFAYENYLMQLDSARSSYNLFLKKYPEHAFANDAQISLMNLGKSPEEIIQAFKAQQAN